MTQFLLAHPWLSCGTLVASGFLFASGVASICRTWLISKAFRRPIMFGTMYEIPAHPQTDEHLATCEVCTKEKRN